jgi:hypothetical protein
MSNGGIDTTTLGGPTAEPMSPTPTEMEARIALNGALEVTLSAERDGRLAAESESPVY